MRNLQAMMGLAVALLVAGGAAGGASGGSGGGSGSPPQVEGVIGVESPEEYAALAVWVPVDGSHALSGLRWYNNDGTVVFPHVRLANGASEDPGPLSSGFSVAEGVPGTSSGWSEVVFSEPVISATGGLFAIFQLPPASPRQYEGAGGGAGIGFGAGGLAAWVSQDGVDWAPLHPGFALAVEPVLVEAAAGMRVMSRQEAIPVAMETSLLPTRPNPFNPTTEIRFTLSAGCPVELAVFNLRGQVVRELLRETRGAGEHVLEWSGTDDAGRALPSGIYVLRLRADGVAQTQRLALLK